MASDGSRKKMPTIYVASAIPKLHEYLIASVPQGVEVKHMHLENVSPYPIAEWPTEETLKFLKDSEVLLCDPNVLIEIYDSLPNLQWAHSTWAGVENLVSAVNEKKVVPKFVVTRHSGMAFALMMAEYVLCQILSIEKRLLFFHECQETKTWFATNNHEIRCLNELVVCILGVGNMGLGVAKLLKAVGCKVIGLSRYQRSPGAKEYAYFDQISTSFADVLPQCDYLCNTLPSTARTRGLLHKEVLRMCEKAPVFINVGRGDIINEDILLEALEHQWISHAVLDVFQAEPLPSSSMLWKSKKVTITPHIAAHSKATHVVEEFIKKYKYFTEEKELDNSVNWSVGY